MLPATELDRANLVFEKMLYRQEHKVPNKEPIETAKATEETTKNASRWPPDLTATKSTSERSKATPRQRTTSNERESVMLRLEQYRSLLSGRATKTKERNEREK